MRKKKEQESSRSWWSKHTYKEASLKKEERASRISEKEKRTRVPMEEEKRARRPCGERRMSKKTTLVGERRSKKKAHRRKQMGQKGLVEKE